MPKRLSRAEFYATTWFALYFEAITDIYLDLKYNLYGYFDTGTQWLSLIPMLGLYPAGNAIILNFYPYNRHWTMKALYVLGTDAVCTIYEATATHTGFFYYNGWKWWYSALVYPFITMILVWNLQIYRMLRKSDDM